MRTGFSKKTLSGIFVAIIITLSLHALSGAAEIPENTAKVVLNVRGMTCSSCIAAINASLAGFEGIKDIFVSLASNKVEVYYDRQTLKDVDKIAAAITASGYPAKVEQILSAAEIRKEEEHAASRAQTHIAAVGDWEIAREDFEIELEHAKGRYAKAYGEEVFSTRRGKALMDNLKAQILNRLIMEGIQIQEINKASFSVDPTTINRRFEKYLKDQGLEYEQFTAKLVEAGYPYPYFMKKFESHVLIDTYLNDVIFSGASTDEEKRRRFGDWLNNARLLAKVVYYDKALERQVQNGSSQRSCCAAR